MAIIIFKRLLEKEEWEKKLNDVKIRKEDMNKLVMNFLVSEGYVEAAEKFHMESGTKHTDLATITDRVAVIRAVQCGNIDDAIKKLNVLNPEILYKNPNLLFLLRQQCLNELIRHRREEDAIEFAQKELVPLGEENQIFMEELEQTFYLLAFRDVSKCPQAELLDMSWRLRVASKVNAAILTSQGHEKVSKLLTLQKMLIWTQTQLDKKSLLS